MVKFLVFISLSILTMAYGQDDLDEYESLKADLEGISSSGEENILSDEFELEESVFDHEKPLKSKKTEKQDFLRERIWKMKTFSRSWNLWEL